MLDAFVSGFLAGIVAYLVLSGFQELRTWRLSVAVKRLQEAMLSDTRRAAANKRWNTDAEMQELLESVKTNKHGVNTPEDPPDKWGEWLKRH